MNNNTLSTICISDTEVMYVSPEIKMTNLTNKLKKARAARAKKSQEIMTINLQLRHASPERREILQSKLSYARVNLRLANENVDNAMFLLNLEIESQSNLA